MSKAASEMELPPFLEERLLEASEGKKGTARVKALMRPADELMRVDSLKCFKASRLSFADMFSRRMVERNWRIRLVRGEVDDDGAGKFVYDIEAEGRRMTYIARAYPWDGIEKVGRRADGALRDMFGALFVGEASEERIEREFATFDVKSEGEMRTTAEVIGWTPANRSSRHFDAVVDALAAGEQPEVGLAYLMRNGGFQSSGRNGSVSFHGIPRDHPLSHPFYADMFAIYLVRVFSIDLVNAIARYRNADSAQLDRSIARNLGIGNSSGQGMCVALQRWPHWVATWVVLRELALAFAKSRAITSDARSRMHQAIAHTIAIYKASDPQVEDYVTPNEEIIANLETVDKWLDGARADSWNEIAEKVADTFDGETREQFNSLLIDLEPEFCDAIAPWLRTGSIRKRNFDPRMTVSGLRDILRRNYTWALNYDRTLVSTHQCFWYHSEDNGEQRRGERVIDPHEEFESFIDHIGLVQRLASVLTTYEDDAKAGEVVLDHPDLHYAISRIQYLDGIPYAEIRDSVAHRDFIPADLIKFYHACLGMRGATPLSIRYVRGTFFQAEPLPQDLSETTTPNVTQVPTEKEVQV
ncbi:hypothetical protein [Roseovarius salis]|uniref:hypothetical protein n=1 Tax=Roseovarius salis TaxID=3376063 RepID=UPI0037C7D2AD